MTESSSSLLNRLRRTPGRGGGIIAAIVAVVLLLVSSLDVLLLDEADDELTIIRTVLGLNVVALLGFLPLLRAVHAVAGRPARPAWLLVAYLVLLLIRPAVLAIDLVAAATSETPATVLGGDALPFLLLASTGLAAGLAAVALQPTHNAHGDPVGSPLRSLGLGVGAALLVALTLFAFAPYVAPVSAMGIAVALSLRKPPVPPDPWEQRVAGSDDGDDPGRDRP